MKPKMTTAIATQMVEKIEKLQNEISATYADADMNYDPPRSGSVIRDAIKERAIQREAEFVGSGLLASFDATDD